MRNSEYNSLVDLNLLAFPAAEPVIEALENKQGFGLQKGNDTVIFDPETLSVYDLIKGKMIKMSYETEAEFMQRLKTVAIDHHTFVTAEKCIELVKPKKLITTDLSLMQKLK